MSVPLPETAVMACMEVRGGNTRVREHVEAAGLDLWVLSVPYHPDEGLAEEGGDVHFVTSCATGRITRLLLADVSGHGPEVAETARALRRLMAAHSNYTDQTALMGAVNDRFLARSEESSSGVGCFATALVVTYFAPTGELHLGCAGHPPPIRYEAGVGQWTKSSLRHETAKGPSDLPLGVLEGVSYSDTTLTLGEGDVVVLYTDAVIEARSPEGTLLGVDGLVGLLGQIGPGEPATVIDRLLGALREYRGGSDDVYDDDLSIVVLARNGLAPRGSLGLGLRATGRLLASAARSVVDPEQPLVLPERTVRGILGAFVDRLGRL